MEINQILYWMFLKFFKDIVVSINIMMMKFLDFLGYVSYLGCLL